MGRRRQQGNKSGCPGDRKTEGVTQLKKPTVRRHFVPALIQHYRRSVVPELARTLPVAHKRDGTGAPFKILVLERKGIAKSIPLKALMADCKDVPTQKLSTTFTGSCNDCTTPKAKTAKPSQKIGRWRVAVASKHAQVVVEVENKPIPSDSSLTNAPDGHQNEADVAPDHHPRVVAKKATKTPSHGWVENKGGDSLVESSRGTIVSGPCTRSRSGRIPSATETVPHASGTGLNTRSLKTDFPCSGGAEAGKERQKCTTRRSLRKRGSREADFNSTGEGVASLLETDLQKIPSSGGKRGRLSQRTEDSSALKRSAETIGARLPASKVAFEGGEGGLEVCAPQPLVTQRRQRSRRRPAAKRRGSRAAPYQKAKAARTNVAQTDINPSAIPEPTRPPSFLYWPNDPTRPPCQPAIPFEPADLQLGFDGIMEWPCVVANAAAESPDSVSQTDEQPRFFLCGGLPDPPRTPPWSRKATSSVDGEHPGASPHRHSPYKCAESSRVTATPHTGCDCRGETPREPSPVHTAPAPAVVVSETVDRTAKETPQSDNQRLSSRMLTADTTMQPTDANQEVTTSEDEEDDWIFTPPDPKRARAIVEHMGDTIRSIIATTQTVQRRIETYSRFCERLLCIDNLRQLSWQERDPMEAGDYMPPRCPGTESKQWPSTTSKSHEVWGQATVRAGRRDHCDRNDRLQNNGSVREEFYCTKPTTQLQPAPDQSAAVSSSVGLHTPDYLADLESRLLRNPAFGNDESAQLCLQLLKKYGRNVSSF